ncbi:MAG: hypothetical protein ACT4PL_05875 [Phycisphaerales bacterium]
MTSTLLPTPVVDAPVVRLAGAASETAAGESWADFAGLSEWWATGLLALVVIGVVVLLASMVFRWWYGLSHVQRATWWLSRRAGLSNADRRLLKALARAREGVEPVAVMLSAGAFDRCAVGLASAGGEGVTRAAIQRLRTRLHGR